MQDTKIPTCVDTQSNSATARLPMTALEDASQLSQEIPIASHIKGWRLHLLTTALCFTVFLVNIEVSIVAVSLIAIVDGLGGLRESSWVVTGYLVTYTCFIVIWAKLSDVFGRKGSMITTLLVFVVFSGGCGASETMVQLIVCRIFQGVGAAGCYTLAVTLIFEMVPKAKFASYASLMSACMASASVLGPILGGLINDHSTWRWIFLLNLPPGAIAIILQFITIPSGFPHHGDPHGGHPRQASLLSKQTLRRLDVPGALFMLGFLLFLVVVLLQAGPTFKWSSPATIAMLVLSLLLFCCFLGWEYLVSETARVFFKEPILPFRFLLNRPLMGIILLSLMVGIPFNVVIVELPIRLQATNSMSPLAAASRILPYTILTPIGSLLSNGIASKKKLPPLYLLLLGSVMQVLGLALMTTIPSTGSIPIAQYIFEAIAGCGVGFTFGLLVTLIPFVVEQRDLAVATGVTMQFRMLGGVVGLGTASAVMSSYLTSQLKLSHASQMATRAVFASSYALQIKIVAGLTGAQFIGLALMWKKEQLQIL